ncbi:hypothetical protein CRUP_016032, partial [Coryphaenoides rupestris]
MASQVSHSTLNVVCVDSQKDVQIATNGVYEAPQTEHAAPACPCCAVSRVSKWLPRVYREELIHILKLAGPVMVSQMMVFLISFVSTVFCGHMGKTELAGVALSIAVINISGISIGTGLASACDTLISQTYGSGNLRRVGVILQRGILILLLACFPCWALIVNTEPLLLAVRQSPEVARLSQFYVQIFMPALPAAFMYQLQGSGSAAANVISQYSLAVSLFIYINCRGLHKATWG